MIISNSSPWVSFKFRDFRLFVIARFLILCAYQMMIVAVGQSLYEKTHDPFLLGMVGLSLFLPKFCLVLFAGHVADRYDRRQIMLFSRVFQVFASMGLVIFALDSSIPLIWLFVVLALMGCANSFDGPASQALVTQIVPIENFGNAVTWNSSTMQIAFIVGPALGGILYAFFGRPLEVFYFVVMMRFLAAVCVALMKKYPPPERSPDQPVESAIRSLLAGIRYVKNTKIILGIISLDLFAVLLGGATALLPIYANDILHVGPKGLGWLRTAPAVGAALMAILLTHRPPLKQAGTTMLMGVGLFGVFTLCFGLSHNFYLSLLFLFLMGASDMVSVVVRGVVVQMQTPPEMRGRVSAVNLMFIGASNELGEFESGLTAKLWGATPAVLIGGIGTLLIVGLWSFLFKEIRQYKKI